MFRQLLRTANERLRLFLSERGRRARVIRDSLRRQRGRIEPSSRFVSGFRHAYFESEARGLVLLKEWLSPEQFAQYDAKSYFEVTGCYSGKRYRICHGTSMNIYELDGAGRELYAIVCGGSLIALTRPRDLSWALATDT